MRMARSVSARWPRRRNSRFGETSDGTMTVTEWAPPNVLGFDIRDGASRVTA
jgi:hypothetical protein